MHKHPKILISIPHQQHSYRTFWAIKDAFDSKYMTSVYYKRSFLDRCLLSILPFKYRETYKDKCIQGIEPKCILRRNFLLGMIFLMASRTIASSGVYPKIISLLERANGRSTVSYCKKKKIDILIMYDNAAEYAFQRLNDTIKILDMSSIPASTIKEIIAKEQITDDYLKESLLGKKAYIENFVDKSLKEIKSADYFFCPSEFVESALGSLGVNKEKIFRIPYGVDLGFFSYKPRTVNQGVLKLLFVGRIEAAKGVYYLFEAIKKFVGNVELHIAGSVLVDLKYIPANVICHGFIDKYALRNLQYDCDVLIMTSLWEGLSLSILEGMSTGLPVICNKSTGYKDIIKTGENGIMIDTLCVRDVEEAIKWVNENRNSLPEMGLNAYEASKNYSWEKYYTNIRNALHSIER